MKTKGITIGYTVAILSETRSPVILNKLIYLNKEETDLELKTVPAELLPAVFELKVPGDRVRDLKDRLSVQARSNESDPVTSWGIGYVVMTIKSGRPTLYSPILQLTHIEAARMTSEARAQSSDAVFRLIRVRSADMGELVKLLESHL